MILDLITWWPFETAFFSFVKVHLSMWSPTVPIGLVDSLDSISGTPGYFWRNLAPEQYYMKTPFTIGRGFYS